MRKKIIRSTTIPSSLNIFCQDILKELQEEEGYEIVAVSSPGNDLDEVGTRERVRTIALPMERRIAPLKDLKALWQMIRILRKEKPDMVHSMTPKAGLLSMIAGWICRLPIRLHTFTGLVFPTSTGLKKRILILTDKITCACATHIIPEGEGVKNDLINYGITRKQLMVLGYGNIKGIDLAKFDPDRIDIKNKAIITRNDLKIQDSDFVFAFVGRLVGDKGINELVEAFTRLQKKYVDSKLILVGPEENKIDPLKPETNKTIDENPAIIAVGSQKDVRPWYALADAFVFPSYREGFPNCVIEAGAMGLPSIVTDINGSREIIINGENGIIIPPKDSKALYDAMKNIMNDAKSRKHMADAARPLIASRYEQSYVRKCLKDFYREILKS